jgi:MFS transporter, DHA1 family, inner membrane transport protein
MASMQTGLGDKSGSAPLAAEQRRREMVLLLILASVQFTSIVDFMVVMPLGPQLRRNLAINPAQFSWIVSSYTIAAGLAALLASSIMDRFGRKSAFLTLYSGFLLGTLFCGLSSGYSMLLIARGATGAFGGILGGLALAIIGDVFPEERRGRATGILMSAFAVASVVGVPAGLDVGTRWGWHIPFLILAGLGLPVLFVGLRILPPLRDHLHQTTHSHPVRQIVETFSHSNHLRAFALTATVMLGSFSVIPFISMYLVSNVGVTETQLTLVFVTGGLLTLVGAPLIGRLADRHGKLLVYRVVAAAAMCLILLVTNLPRVPLAFAVGIVGTFMLSNAGRMVAALAMVTGSVERRLRGGFMSANSAVQHLASGVGVPIGGWILSLTKSDDGRLHHFNLVGLFALVATALSLWLAGRVQPAHEQDPNQARAKSDQPAFSPEVLETTLDYPADQLGAEPF